MWNVKIIWTKKMKLWNTWHYVWNKTQTVQHVIKNYAFLLPKKTNDPLVVHSYLHPIYIYMTMVTKGEDNTT
jgi:hypothetical protein